MINETLRFSQRIKDGWITIPVIPFQIQPSSQTFEFFLKIKDNKILL